ncbi:MAG: hypothetical protein ABSA66_18365 [Roseiarcus sp.]
MALGRRRRSHGAGKRFRALKGEIDKAMRLLIREGVKDKSIAKRNVKTIAFTLAGALDWPARRRDPEGKESAESLAAQMADILTAALAPR